MNKILVLSPRDSDEMVAARNLCDAISELAPRGARVETVALPSHGQGPRPGGSPELASAPGRSPFSWPGLSRVFPSIELFRDPLESLARLRHEIHDLLLSFGPDAVVITCPLHGHLIAELYRDGRTRDFSLISLVPDLMIEPGRWPQVPCDWYLVANKAVASGLEALGVPGARVRVLGYPAHAIIDDKASPRPDLAGDGHPRILYVVNSGRKKAPKLLARLLKKPDWHVTVCVEGDARLAKILRDQAGACPDRIRVVETLSDLPELLRDHHVVVTRAATGIVHEAIAANCPVIVNKLGPGLEATNFAALHEAHAGALARKPREVIDLLERAFRHRGRLLALWRRNLKPLAGAGSTTELARFILEQACAASKTEPILRALPPPLAGPFANSRRAIARDAKQVLLCDLHTHSTWSDGKLSIAEMVDFYGQRGFDCLCITDHLCDPQKLLGRLVNLTGLVIPPGEIEAYFAEIEREKKRARAKYDLLLMAGIEFNKDGYTARSSAHLLGVDLQGPISPSLGLKELIVEIHRQGGLAIASHPHEMKSEWGRNTLYLWEHVEEFAPLLDAWEVANRDDIFNPVGLKKLPFVANSDFHKPKHIHSWKTVLYCEKDATAIKECIRANRDVSITLYRDHRFALDDAILPLTAAEELEERPSKAPVLARRG